MCGGCNIYAEGVGVSLIVARYWWVARQGAKAVAAAEAIAERSIPAGSAEADGFVDPLPELTRIT